MNANKSFVLLLDSGNTRLKCRCIGAKTGVLYTQFSAPNGQLEALEPELKRLEGEVVAIHAVAVTSTELKQSIERLFKQVLGASRLNLHWHHSAEQTVILRNHYEPVQHLGNDRWFGMIGVLSQVKRHSSASAQSPKPIMYISFGTATTIDTIYAQDFLGGMILPGVDLMQSSLKQGTAQLPLVEINADTVLDQFPLGTQAAITTGIVAAQVGAIIRQCMLVHDKFAEYPDIYVTGGARFGILPELKRILLSLPQLTSSSIALYELEAPVLDGLHYHYVKEYLGK